MKIKIIYAIALLLLCLPSSAQEKIYIWSEIDPGWKGNALEHWEKVKGYGKTVPMEMSASIREYHSLAQQKLILSLKSELLTSGFPKTPEFPSNPGSVFPANSDLFLDLQCRMVEVSESYPYFRVRKIKFVPQVKYKLSLYGPDGAVLLEKEYLDSIDYKNTLRPLLRGMSEHRRDVEIVRYSYLESLSGNLPEKMVADLKRFLETEIAEIASANPETFFQNMSLLFEERKLKHPADYEQVNFSAPSKPAYTLSNKSIVDKGAHGDDRWSNELSLLVNKSRYYALIIGVNDYLDPQINDLNEPLKDASNLLRTLKEGYTFEEENIRLLENPTRDDIIASLDKLAYELNEEDNLLIFYAGHGLWDEQLKKGFWIPSDASTDNRANWFSNSDLRDYIGGIKARHTLLISDACFSGGIFKTREAFSMVTPATLELYKLDSRKAMTSGAMTTVPDKSVFIEYLIKRLRENQNQFLSAEQLFASFKIAVINNSPTKQVPQFGEIRETGDEGGDFLFIRRSN